MQWHKASSQTCTGKKGKKTPQLSPNMNSKNNSGNSGMNTDEFWHMNYPNAFITVFLGTGE